MTEDLKQLVRAYADAHADAHGFAATPVPGLDLVRSYAPTGLTRGLYKPLLCLVLQGDKQVAVGAAVHTFAAGQSAIVSVDRPFVSRIVRASRREPYLALAVELDMGVVREVSGAMPRAAPAAAQVPAVLLDDTDAATIDCAARLMRLIDHPAAIPVLRDATVREMHYWLLAGRHGPALRRLALPDGHAARVARAVAVLRAEFAQPLPVDRLAAEARMSPSSFHQHFKAVTSMSPLQFQKQLRLLEARRLMLGEGLSAGSAAHAVGYESASQFSRDYARLFGAPPGRDASEARAA